MYQFSFQHHLVEIVTNEYQYVSKELYLFTKIADRIHKSERIEIKRILNPRTNNGIIFM